MLPPPQHTISYTNIKAVLALQTGETEIKFNEYPTETLIIYSTYTLENSKMFILSVFVFF